MRDVTGPSGRSCCVLLLVIRWPFFSSASVTGRDWIGRPNQKRFFHVIGLHGDRTCQRMARNRLKERNKMTSLARLNVFGHRVIAISLGLLGGIFLSPWCHSWSRPKLGPARSEGVNDSSAIDCSRWRNSTINRHSGFHRDRTVTYYWDAQDTGNVTVKSRGLHQFRVDATLPEGTL